MCYPPTTTSYGIQFKRMAHDIHTAEQLLGAGDIGRCELLRGELVTMIPPGGRHGELANLLAHHLTAFVVEAGTGSVLAETGFVLRRAPDTVRAPDIAFLRPGRPIGDEYIDGPPELAIEVVSPGDRAGYVREKVAEWLESGAETVWVVDPRKLTVAVHIAGQASRVLGETDILRGEPVLPGFELPLARLF